MTIDSIVSGVAISAGKTVAEKGIREIAKKTSKFHREIKDDFNVLNEDITISCPENIQKCSTIFECKHKLMNNKKRIKGGKVCIYKESGRLQACGFIHVTGTGCWVRRRVLRDLRSESIPSARQ